MCGNVLNQLCFWKNHNVELKLGTLSVSTYSVVCLSQSEMVVILRFSLGFFGEGGLKT